MEMMIMPMMIMTIEMDTIHWNADDGTNQVSDVTAEVDGVPNHEGCGKSQNHL